MYTRSRDDELVLSSSARDAGAARRRVRATAATRAAAAATRAKERRAAVEETLDDGAIRAPRAARVATVVDVDGWEIRAHKTASWTTYADFLPRVFLR